ncbi:MAG: glycosyltransferase family 2 protein [Metallibacterium scheffleri]|jgi:GT2 family glycosyltransferase
MSRALDTPPRISVCIANYNGETMLRDCLESVYGQRTDFQIEVLLHDDASTDGSVALIRNEFPDVRVIQSRDNVGFCISNNRMAEAARGHYLLLLNNDAVLRPGSLDALLREACDTTIPAVLGLPQYTLHDGSLVDRGYEFDLFMNPIPVFTTSVHEVATATGACLWIPREVWSAVGGFPPWFESIAEDIYLCQAARLLGYPTRVLDAPGFDHWIGKNLGGGKVMDDKLKTTARRRALSERNKTAVMLLCYPAWALLVLLPIHALLLGIEASFLWLAGSGRDKIKSIYGTILPGLWRHRKDISALRRSLRARQKQSGWRFMRRFHWLPHKLRMLLRHGAPEIG